MSFVLFFWKEKMVSCQCRELFVIAKVNLWSRSEYQQLICETVQISKVLLNANENSHMLKNNWNTEYTTGVNYMQMLRTFCLLKNENTMVRDTLQLDLILTFKIVRKVDR